MNTTQSHARFLTSILLLAAPGVAQTFYVDFDPQAVLPSNGYHAAAPVPYSPGAPSSYWNLVDSLQTTIQPLDVDGRPTCLSLDFDNTQNGYSDGQTCPGHGWGPDEFALYDGFRVIEAGLVTLTGLVPGDYQIYTYGKTQLVQRTEVKIGADVQVITNSCNGLWFNPGTYVVHNLTVQPGDVVVVELKYDGGGGPGAWGKISAMQVVRSGDRTAGTRFCGSLANSTGFPSTFAARGTLDASGAVSVSANDLLLTCDNVPAGQPGIFFYGGGQTQFTFGNGYQCVSAGGAAIARMAPSNACGDGVLYHELDMTNPPSALTQILPGSTWYLQAWYRDPAGGGAFFNLSDGLAVTFGL
jgi:hypothetical protein